jgi:predicted transcriptional regulator
MNAVAALPMQTRVAVLNLYRKGDGTRTIAAAFDLPESDVRDWLRGLGLLRTSEQQSAAGHRQAVEQRTERVVRPLTPLAPSVFDSALVAVRAALVREYRALGLATPTGVIPFEDGGGR